MGRIYQTGNFGFASMQNDASATTLLVHSNTTNGSTTFTDSSSSATTLTAAGDAQHSTTQQKWGTTGMKFDGTGDYVDVTGTYRLDDDFTIDFWVRFDDLSTDRGLFGYYKDDDHATAFKWDQGSEELEVDYDNAADSGTETWSWLPVVNTWYHVAFVRWSTPAGALSYLSAFVDGKLLSTKLVIGDTMGGVTSPWYIGTTKVSASEGFIYHNGYIDEFRVVEDKAMWTANFIPPQGPYRQEIT